MARSAIPDPLRRRHLLEDAKGTDKALAVAEAYLEEGRASEALAFLELAGATDRLEAVRDEAITAGDAFLLRAACSALGSDPSAEQWTRAAEAAERAGKDRYAQEARRQAHRSD